ncbi:hypothetical protein BYT27DRAFT_6735384 [Phlegmacium glaucopus]|nr:hypothetical protein BYT27DRAFT_6735384 [Phlegmacium glaucopus]
MANASPSNTGFIKFSRRRRRHCLLLGGFVYGLPQIDIMADNYNIDFPNDGSFPFPPEDDAWSEIDWSSLAVDGTNNFSTAHTSSSTSSTSPDSSFLSFITDTSIAVPITQAWPPCTITTPQETQARPQHQPLDAFHNQSSTYIPGVGFSAPEEVSGRKLELHGLKYYQINPSRNPPYHVLLFTIPVSRRDISKVDR